MIRSPSFVAIGTIIVVLSLIPGAFRADAQLYSQSNTLTDDQSQVAFRQCMLQALNARETARSQAHQQYFSAFTQAYDSQWQQMKQAWQIADSRSRNDALREAKRAFNLTERTLRKERSTAFRDADRQYSASRRECNDQLRNDRSQERRTGTAPFSSFSYSSWRSSSRSFSRSSVISGWQNEPIEQGGVYDQTSYYDALLRRAELEQQIQSYQRTGAVSSAYGVGDTQTNAWCGDGTCQAGEQGFCAQDCTFYLSSSSAARSSTASAEWNF